MANNNLTEKKILDQIKDNLKGFDSKSEEETVKKLKEQVDFMECQWFLDGEVIVGTNKLKEKGLNYNTWKKNKKEFEQALENSLSSIEAIEMLLKDENAGKPTTVSDAKWKLYGKYSKYIKKNNQGCWQAQCILQGEFKDATKFSEPQTASLDPKLLLLVEYYMLQRFIKDYSRYSRNELFINEENQKKIKDACLVILGLNTGSRIAEDALRLGFEQIILYDNDDVLSNTKTYNYTLRDTQKTKALEARLKAINKEAKIEVKTSIEEIKRDISKKKCIVVNDLPKSEKGEMKVFCETNNIPSVYPFHTGSNGGGAFIVSKNELWDEVWREEEEVNAISVRVASAQTVSLLYHLSIKDDKSTNPETSVYYHSLNHDKKNDQLMSLIKSNTWLSQHQETLLLEKDQRGANNCLKQISLHIKEATPFDIKHKKIFDKKILFAGAGVGSVIAEVVVRMGFNNIVLLDTDSVDLSNLNRQNYTMNDVGKSKVIQLENRLKSINNKVKIKGHKVFLNEKNVQEYIDDDVAVAVNALDYDNGAPFIFDKACLEKNKEIKIIHPGNFSWGAQAFVVSDEKSRLDSVIKEVNLNSVVRFLHTEIKKQYPYINLKWFTEIPSKLIENPHLPSPQMSVGAGLVAAQTTKIMIDILNGVEHIKSFPEVYFVNANFDSNKS
ncbi:ThiF family adenylyltransferase [uncultured Microscilla sp.]|uniref:ThiF family adenylyltransferase n=1 Tax=uncultured Microscilla sp. TaxID=432653 RepID=UPI0026170891|nr:ThiF family adenylyltransferase [uncultured Microscilla sp.]